MTAEAVPPSLDWVALFNRSTQQHAPLASGTIRTRAEAGAYASRAFDSEVEIVAATEQGGRNERLNVAAFNLGQLVGAGLLDEAAVADALTAAGLASGLEPGEVAGTVRSGIRGGKAKPRSIAPAPERLAIVRDVSDAEITGSDASPADAAADPAVEVVEGDVLPERTSWWRRPLAERAASDAAEPEPTHLIRTDGARLLYSGKVNGLLGESESGKSWVALLAAIQAVREGQRVFILDFEDAPGSIYRRLRSMGLTSEEEAQVDYADPGEALNLSASNDLGEAIAGHAYGLIVVDGVNAAMALLGYDLVDNADATRFAQGLLRPLASSGSCILTVDHVPKDSEKRGKGGIGAQAKRAMVDGASIRVEVVSPFGAGQSGELRLTVDKDRPGKVRAVSLGSSAAGRAHLVSIADTVELKVVPAGAGEDEEAGAAWAPTGLMEKVSRLLEVSDALSGREVTEEVGGKASYVRDALRLLVENGYVSTAPGPNRRIEHRSTTPYREGDELGASRASQCVPGASGTRSDAGASLVPPPMGRDAPADTPDGHADDGNRDAPTEAAVDPDYSDCNRCGTLTPGWVIARTQGYCQACHKVVGR